MWSNAENTGLGGQAMSLLILAMDNTSDLKMPGGRLETQMTCSDIRKTGMSVDVDCFIWFSCPMSIWCKDKGPNLDVEGGLLLFISRTVMTLPLGLQCGLFWKSITFNKHFNFLSGSQQPISTDIFITMEREESGAAGRWRQGQGCCC